MFLDIFICVFAPAYLCLITADLKLNIWLSVDYMHTTLKLNIWLSVDYMHTTFMMRVNGESVLPCAGVQRSWPGAAHLLHWWAGGWPVSGRGQFWQSLPGPSPQEGMFWTLVCLPVVKSTRTFSTGWHVLNFSLLTSGKIYQGLLHRRVCFEL